MAIDEVELFFTKYVPWMCRDIQREIALERATKDAGNLLCALGLLVYTEALGRVRRWNDERSSFYSQSGREQSEQNFLAAFNRFDGNSYGAWREVWQASQAGTSIYEVLRSGMVHEYRPKVRSRIWFGHERDRGVDETHDEQGPLLAFYIVPYLRHFAAEAVALQTDLARRSERTLPPAFLRRPGSVKTVVVEDISSAVTSSSMVSGSSVASGPDLEKLSPEERLQIFRRE